MKNTEIASRLYDAALSNERLRMAAREVASAAQTVLDSADRGLGWKIPVDTSAMTRMAVAQKDLEMREALALAAGATDEDVAGAYEHQKAGDLMAWLSEVYPGA